MTSRYSITALLLAFASGCVLTEETQELTALEQRGALTQRSVSCDVIVAGGTTAALAAALTAAREGAQTCLLEPTDWPGGQMTAGGVPAIDYAWHRSGTYDVGAVAKLSANLPPEFVRWMEPLGAPGVHCSVSKDCYEPKRLLTDSILPTISRTPNLQVFKSTVVKQVRTDAQSARKTITEVLAIRRTARSTVAWGGYDLPLSVDMQDWYSASDSDRYTKELITLTGVGGRDPIVIDATELGDVLALSDAPYMQGVETSDGATQAASELCGQAFVYPFVMRIEGSTTSDDLPKVTPDHPEFYGFGNYDWNKIWVYRRLKGTGSPAPGQLTVQNWYPGNDYGYQYLLKSKADARTERADWRGGVSYAALDAGERHAYGFFRWYRDRAPNDVRGRLSLARDVMGTGHGFSKFPYVRDTRRSVGADNFVLRLSDLQAGNSTITGKRFIDRVAIGAYAADIHPMDQCEYPSYVYGDHTTLPFYLPLRALTNRDVGNLLVAGKTMAQSFMANSATRLQPIEYSSGIAAGAAAATMTALLIDDTGELISRYATVQSRARKHGPIDWTIGSVTYPRPGEVLDPIGQDLLLFCPTGTEADLQLGYCVDASNAYGPFTNAMTQKCSTEGGGPACNATMAFTIDGHRVNIPRWSRKFAAGLRGNGSCMRGAQKDAVHTRYCIEEAAASASGVKEVYGPFEPQIVARCRAAGGGDACYTNRWSYAFFRKLAD